ncbi:MAG: PilC/PilY family type IV pilus protein [Myxococcota bacterium]
MVRVHLHQSRVASVIALVLFLLPLAVNAGDEDIFSTQIAPNVVLMVDNSGSMNAIMEHEAFDASTFTPTCDVFNGLGAGGVWLTDDNSLSVLAFCWSAGDCILRILPAWYGDWTATTDPTDDANSGYIERTFCGQTRRLYTDGINVGYGNETWYYLPWVNFLFSIDSSDTATTYGDEGLTAQEILDDVDDPASGQNYITGETFASHQIARITAARQIARDVIYQTNSDCPAFLGDCGVYEDRVRFGIAQFQGSSHGGFVNAPVEAYSTNRTDLTNAINSLDASTATPLSETLFKLYTYFMSRDTADVPVGQDGATSWPTYQYNDSDGLYTASSAPPDPVEEECQRNFIIMISDGDPSADDYSTSGSETQGFTDFAALVGDYAPDAVGDPDIGTDTTPEEGSPPWPSATGTGYLDDIALFMQQTDCRPDYPDTQNVVDVYTVGFTTTGPVNSLLQKTADNGNGLYFNGNQAEELTEALVSSVQDIISKSQGFSAATVPAARTSDGGQLYTTLFQPTSARPFWPGLIRSYKITVAGEIEDANGNCALEDLDDPTVCTGGTFKSEDEAPPFWNASKLMPGANGRNMRVSLAGTTTQNVVDFDHAITAADLGGASVLGSTSDYPPVGTVTAYADLDEAIVAFVAGCEWGTGMTAAGTTDFSGCTDRTRIEDGSSVPDRLGDIFHSNPVVVGNPRSFIPELSYSEYAARPEYVTRDRIIVAGANDGFLHGFNAGEWDNSIGTYDAGTGEEVFAFMPWSAREKVADLAKDDSTLHPLSVDGSPAVADVWIDSNSDVDDAKLWSEWKTILVTGMREGGEQYLSLDMTDPTATDYPGYNWEFPLESDTTWRDYVGQTWSQPVITRIRLEQSDGDVEERWVAIAGFGYDATSDVNDSAQYDAASLKGRGIVMLDIDTGRPVAVRKFGTATGDVADMLYAIPSAPAVLDYDQDGFADIIYIGDLGGNVWKWVVRDAGNANPTDAQLYQANWPFRKFFDHDPSTGATDHARSFYFAPSATVSNGILHIGLGSGERSDLNCTSTLRGCDVLNRFYILKDRDVWEQASSSTIDGRDVNADGELTDVTLLPDDCPAIEPSGLFFTVADGEKFVTNSEVFNAFFFVSTFAPDLTNVCEPSGIASLYGFLAKCGQGFFGPPSTSSPIAGTQRTMDLGRGMPTDARLSIAPGDNGNRLIISKQDGEIINLSTGASDSEHGVMYWRELD